MNAKRLVIGVIIFAIVAVCGYGVYRQFLAPKSHDTTVSETPTAEPADGNNTNVQTGAGIVTAEGRIVPLDDIQLSFQTGGEIIEIFVTEGDKISAGDPLLQLDTTDQEIAVMQAQAATVQAEANIKSAEAELLAAQAGVTASQVAVDASKAQLALLKSGPTEAQIALSTSQVAIAEAGVRQAEGGRDVSLEGATDAALAAAKARLAAAQAEYNAAIRSFQPIAQDEKAGDQDRQQAQLQINAALAKLQSAQAELDQLQAGPTTAARTTANSSVNMAVDLKESAQAALNLLLAGSQEEQIAVAETAITQEEDQIAESELRVSLAETAVTQARAAMEETQIKLNTAKSILEKRTLTSPITATVAAILIKEHQVVTSGMPVIMLADLSQWRIKTVDLTEIGVVNLDRDLPVEITLKAFPGDTLSGHVADIASTSDLIRGDVTYIATIAIDDDQDLPLRWGMTAYITLDTN